MSCVYLVYTHTVAQLYICIRTVGAQEACSFVLLKLLLCVLFFLLSSLASIAVSSDSKELYAGYSSRQVVGWVKPKSSSGAEEGDYDQLGMEAYFASPRT